MTTTKPTRQRIDPTVKAQEALALADRKLAVLDKQIANAKTRLTEAEAERAPLVAARDYAAANPLLGAEYNTETDAG